tara:strand:+ start:391 stop:576 length:186 start_codon:yes stop_codon:yes gene_type:complete
MSEKSQVPYKAMTYPVDEWGRLGGLFSLADVPIAKYVRYQELREEDQKKIDRHHMAGSLNA